MKSISPKADAAPSRSPLDSLNQRVLVIRERRAKVVQKIIALEADGGVPTSGITANRARAQQLLEGTASETLAKEGAADVTGLALYRNELALIDEALEQAARLATELTITEAAD